MYHVANPVLAVGVLKNISCGCARKFYTLVFICPKEIWIGLNLRINIPMQNLGLTDVQSCIQIRLRLQIRTTMNVISEIKKGSETKS